MELLRNKKLRQKTLKLIKYEEGENITDEAFKQKLQTDIFKNKEALEKIQEIFKELEKNPYYCVLEPLNKKSKDEFLTFISTKQDKDKALKIHLKPLLLKFAFKEKLPLELQNSKYFKNLHSLVRDAISALFNKEFLNNIGVIEATRKQLAHKEILRNLDIFKEIVSDNLGKVNYKITKYDLTNKADYDNFKTEFLLSGADKEQLDLFNRILPIAKELKVKIIDSLDEIEADKQLAGIYFLSKNTIYLREMASDSVILHELIHAVTSRAINIKETDLLTKPQKEALKDIQAIYEEALKVESLKGEYGTTDIHEFLAELSNPPFREKLKRVNLFEKIIDAFTRLFTYTKELISGTKGENITNAYERTKKALYQLIDNYNPNFADDYVKKER